MKKRPVKRKKRRQISLSGYQIGIICGLVLVIYLIGVFHYRNRFQRSVRINDVRVGGMTVNAAKKMFEEDFASHKITIKEKERTETIRAEDIGTKIDTGDQIAEVFKKESAFAWPFRLFGRRRYTIDVHISYDEDRMKEVEEELELFDPGKVIAPENAGLKAGKKKFRIVSETEGNTVDKEAFDKRLDEVFTTGKTEIDLVKEDLYILPKNYAKDEKVKAALKKANRLTAGSVIYDLDYTKEVVDYKKTKDWIDVSDDLEVSYDESKVGDFVQSLGKKYNTMGSRRHFTTFEGKDITIYDGNYGWKIYFDKEKKQLLKDLKSGKKISRKPIYSYEAMCRRSEDDDIGDSYVEVSIDKQKLWLIIDGTCKMTSNVVTGKPNKDAETKKGVYAITYKQSPATLTGPNAAGGSYSSEVDYWMPFNGNQGLHNAPWRKEFGGAIYKTNGSHGCVNMPYAQAKMVYENVKKGYPVIIY